MFVSTLNISSLGCVAFVRSPKAKYQRITIRPDKTISVTIPRGGSLGEAKEFLKSKISWVQEQLQKIDRHNQCRESLDLDIDIEKSQKDLFSRLESFSQKHSFPYNRAGFRCQKTKWGSCSGINNISLNVNIAFLPQELQDYILLHELVHTKVKNHSKSFWAELDRYTDGRAKQLSKELKKYRMRLRQ